MKENTVILIVDPVQSRASELAKALGDTYPVVVICEVKACKRYLIRLKPMAVVANFVQKGTHGAFLCHELRHMPEGKRCLMIVHGSPPGQVEQGRQKRRQIETRWSLDAYIPMELHGTSLKQLLASEAIRRKRQHLRTMLTGGSGIRERRKAEAGARGMAVVVSNEPKTTRQVSTLTFRQLLTADLTVANILAFLSGSGLLPSSDK